MDKAEESNRLKSAFLNNISHEIRTPLNGILGFADLFVTEGLTHEEKLEYHAILQDSSNRLLQTITDIIDKSEQIAHTIKPRPEDVHLAALMKHNLYQYTTICSQKKLMLTMELPTEHDSLVMRTDEAILNKVFKQLLDNAVKFTVRGGIVIGCTVLDHWLRFYVKDTGKGIAADQLEAIFEPFTQEDISLSRRFEGSGLGLSVAKGFVEILGGRIWAESQKEVGSAFYFEIPRF